MVLFALVTLLIAALVFATLRLLPEHQSVSVRVRLATPSYIVGLVSVALAGVVAVLSFTDALGALPFRDVLAVVAFLSLPLSVLGVGAGVVAWREGGWRARTGLGLSTIALAAWVGMESLLT